MSPVAHIPSHRKPRRATSTRALRAGVTGGFLTLAVAGAAVPASATESNAAPAESTLEMPTVSATLASTAAQTADATQQAASDYELQAQKDQAAAHAKIAAKKTKAEADRKAKEAREAARKAAAKRAAEAKAQAAKASRSAERTTLSTSTSASTTVSNASGNAATLISFLKAQLGKAYVLGSSGPSSYDCSGLTQAAFKQIGVSLPRVSQDQSTTGTPVSLDSLQPGDLLYWGSAGSAYHVGVYVGGGKFIGAQNPSTGIVERPLDYDMPTGAVRVL
ncbi:C40 family peptidase [Streptomyces sp. NPDC059455]|uniref:C40 family peptidase n=1 Tax=Streptomyces sp. NPDC059455 TaxID=3346837 RepID=UPI00369621E0